MIPVETYLDHRQAAYITSRAEQQPLLPLKHEQHPAYPLAYPL